MAYGINTKTMFDKRDFEAALLEARRDLVTTNKLSRIRIAWVIVKLIWKEEKRKTAATETE